MLKKKNKNNKKTPTKRKNFPVTDIQIPTSKRVVKEVLGIKEYRTLLGKIYALSWRFIFAFFFVTYIFTGATPLDYWHRTIGAIGPTETVVLNASICSMNQDDVVWNNVHNAEGGADLEEGSDIENFNRENAAYYQGGKGSLLCSGFGDDLNIERVVKKDINSGEELENGEQKDRKKLKSEGLNLNNDEENENDMGTTFKNINSNIDNKTDDNLLKEVDKLDENIGSDEYHQVKFSEKAGINSDQDNFESLKEESNNLENGKNITDKDKEIRDIKNISENDSSNTNKSGKESIKPGKIDEVDVKSAEASLQKEKDEQSGIENRSVENTDESDDTKPGETAIDKKDLLSEVWGFVSDKVGAVFANADEFTEEHITDMHDLGKFKEARIKMSFAGKSRVNSEIKNKSKEETENDQSENISDIKSRKKDGELMESPQHPISDNGSGEEGFDKNANSGKETKHKEINDVNSVLEGQDINSSGAKDSKSNVLELGNGERDEEAEKNMTDDSDNLKKDADENNTKEKQESIEEPEASPENITDVNAVEEKKQTSAFKNIFKNLFNMVNASDLEMRDAKIVIWYSLSRFDFNNKDRLWKRLDVITKDNTVNYDNGGFFSYPAPFLESWDDVADLQIKFEGVVDNVDSYTAYLDSVWVETDYVNETETEKIEKKSRLGEALEFLSKHSSVSVSSNGELKFRYNKKETKNFRGVVDMFSDKSFWNEVGIETKILNARGEIVQMPLDMIFEESGEFIVKLPIDSPVIGPGKYKLVFDILDDSADVTEYLQLEQEFSWGVLAMNFDKSVYEPFEIGYLQMAVLNDFGHSVCDAELDMRVMTPRGTERIVSTENKRIVANPECGPNNVIEKADYFVHYDFEEAGEYTFTLTATTTNGVKSIAETIQVVDSVPYVIERSGPTRIYPKADYDMALKITAKSDFFGTVVDYLPAEFNIYNYKLSYYDKLLEYFVDYKKNRDFYFDKEKDGERQKLILYNLGLKAGDVIEIRYTMDAPDISPEFYLLGPLEFYSDKDEDGELIERSKSLTPNGTPPLEKGDFVEAKASTISNSSFFKGSTSARGGVLIFAEYRQWQIASDANVFRITEYYLSTGDFTGITYDLTLDNDLADDYFIFVRGSKTGDAGSNPDNDYARVYRVPNGRGDLADSGSANVISLSRFVADFEWEGVVTIVECLADTDNAGFKLLDVMETPIVGTALSGNGTVATPWTDINQVVPFGGYHAGGAEFEVAAADTMDGDVVYTRLWPSGTDTINWQRVDNGGGALLSSTLTTFVVEWGASWNVQHALVSGANAGNGANALMEYSTSSISSVTRDNTWVWGTGVSSGDGIGDDAEGSLVTLGDGVNQNVTEAQVAVGAEYAFQRDFDVYVMEHSGLAVDYHFKEDTDKNILDVPVQVDMATEGQRLALVYNGCNGSGSAHPRDRFWARYTNDTTITVSRGYDGQDFPAWVTGVDFSAVTYAPPIPTTKQAHFRWRDDSTNLNTNGGWLYNEDTNKVEQEDKNNLFRLRISVANDGSVEEVASRQYELQWGEKLTTCDNIVVWRGLSDYTDAFELYDSSYIASDGVAVTSALLTNTENYSFLNGVAHDVSDTTSDFGPIASSTYTELEYAMRPTDYATPGANYCFRLYDKKANTVLDEYSNYPEMTISYVDISETVMEWGTKTGVTDDGWTTIAFVGSYLNPVAVCTLRYANNIGNEVDGDADSVVCRMQNTGATSTQVKLQEAGDTSGALTQAETVNWIVVEEGTYNNSNIKLEAFKYTSTITDGKGSWVGESQNYSQTYATPVVIGQVMTYNDINWSTFWAHGAAYADPPDASNLYTGKQVSEDSNTTRSNETVGVIVVEQADNALGGVAYEAYAPTSALIDRIDDNTTNTYTFQQSFSEVPTVGFVSIAGINGGDGPFAVLYGATPFTTSTINPIIMEDEIADTEQSGSSEDVHYFVLENSGTYTAGGVALDQTTFKFYENTDSSQPGTALAAENTSISSVDDGDIIRLRVAIQTGLADLLLSDVAFKLQYAQGSDCSIASGWTDVDYIGGAGIWRGYDNSTPLDGTKITTSLLNDTANELQSYEESNPTVKNPSEVTRGKRGEWDFTLENNGADYGADYCFRMVTKNGKALQYTKYPKLTTTALNISGVVYSDQGITPLLTSPRISLVIDGVGYSSTTASVVDGSYSFSGIVQPGIASSVVVYLDNSTEKGFTLDRYDGEGDIEAMNIYENTLVITHDDLGPVTENDLNKYDKDQDTDITFRAKPLTLDSGQTLYVPPSKILELNGGDLSFGDMKILGEFRASSTETITISGSADFSNGIVDTASSTFEFFSGGSKTIQTGGNAFYNLKFSGGGSWTLLDSATSTATTTIESGTLVQGMNNDLTVRGLEVESGAVFTKDSGSGRLVFESEVPGYFIDKNVELNNLGIVQVGYSPATTTLLSDIQVDSLVVNAGDALLTNGYDINASSSISVYGKLDCSDFGEGDETKILLDGNWLVDSTGIFIASTSSVVFGGSSDNNINSGGVDYQHNFYNLTIAKNNASSSLVSYGMDVEGDFKIQQDAGFDVTAGNYEINAGGEWLVFGNFNARSGTIIFDSVSTGNRVDNGESSFYNLDFDNLNGGWVIWNDLLVRNNLDLSNATLFIASSSIEIEVQGVFNNSVGGVGTNWNQSNLYLNGDSVEIDTKISGGDNYYDLHIGSTTAIRMWDTSATNSYTIDDGGSLYSMDHNNNNGQLYIWGDYSKKSGKDYWSYATDFDGTSLLGSERQVLVYLADSTVVNYNGGEVDILGSSTNSSLVTNQGVGNYELKITNGVLSADYFQIRNISRAGLELYGTTTVTKLNQGDFLLDIDGATMLTVASTTIDFNSAKTISNNTLSKSGGISSGYNVVLVGTSSSYWEFGTSLGNYIGEANDFDFGTSCGGLRWADSDCSDVAQVHYRWRNDNNDETLASWKAAEDTPVLGQKQNENLRLRFTLDNIGGGSADSMVYTLQVAQLADFGSCASVPSISYGDVASTTGGDDHVVMELSNYFDNSTSTTNQLTNEGVFTPGYTVEENHNYTPSISLPVGNFTEVEYSIEFMYDAVKNSTYCFRNNSGGIDLTSYNKIAEIRLEGVQVRGTAYDDEAGTAWSQCNVGVNNISLVVNGVHIEDKLCTPSGGNFSFSDVFLQKGDVVSVFFNTAGGNTDKAVAVSHVYNTDQDLVLGLVKDTTWIHNEIGAPIITNANLAHCDSDNVVECSNVPYNVVGNDLFIEATSALILEDNDSYTPGGNITTALGSVASALGGDIKIKSGATLNIEENEIFVGGSWINDGNFIYSGVATTTFTSNFDGNSIEAGSSAFYNLVFTGTGGWSIDTAMTVNNDITIATGTVTGSGDVLVSGGDCSGDGTITMSSGTFTVDNNGDFGGLHDWTFYNLEFGDGVWSRTTNKIGANNILVDNTLTISASQILNASSNTWEVRGEGDAFVETGDFIPENSIFIYSGTSDTNILATTYNKLELAPYNSGTPTYTLDAGDLTTLNYFYVGDGINPVSVDSNINAVNMDIDGLFKVLARASFTAPDSDLRIGDSWEVIGNFYNNNAKVVMDASSTSHSIVASTSAFYDLDFDNTAGGWEIDKSLVVENDLNLKNATSFGIGTSSNAWYDKAWSSRKLISLNSLQVTADLENYVALISITDTDIQAKALASGYDIIFTSIDGQQILSFEIESYDSATGKLVAWVKIPLLSSSKNTDIYVYYGNDVAINQENQENTWDEYKSVWHMAESPTGTSDEIVDSTAHGYNGTSFGNMSATSSVSAQIGDGFEFNGTSDYIALDLYYDTANVISKMTACVWFNTSFTGSGYNDNWAFLDFDRSEYFDFYLGGVNGELYFSTNGTGGTNDFYGTTSGLNDGNWHMGCVVYDGTDKKIYVDGNPDGTDVNTHSGDALGSGTSRYALIADGSEADTFNSRQNNIFYEGMMDELQYMEVGKSADWVKTSFNNQNNPSTFINIGVEEQSVNSHHIEVEVQGTFLNLLNDAETNWGTSTLFLNGDSETICPKTSEGDTYNILRVGDNVGIKMWNSSTSFANVGNNAYLYSMDNSGVDGSLYIWGDYKRTSGVEYWSYGTDFDGTNIVVSPRKVKVLLHALSSVNIQNSVFQIIGDSDNMTEIADQCFCSYGLTVDNSLLNASYFSLRDTDELGLNLENSSQIVSLDNGDFEVKENDFSAITVDASTLNNNPLEVVLDTTINKDVDVSTAKNVTVTGEASSAWIFRNHSGNLDGEDFDGDPGDPRGYIIWDDSPEYSPKSQNWRWYYDIDNETPLHSITSENTTPLIGPNSKVKLRVTVNETEGLSATNVKMRLQYSLFADFSQDVFDVAEAGNNTAIWKYADGVDTDDDLLTTRVLSDSLVLGTHNESGISVSTYDHNTPDVVEWEFSLHNNGATAGNIYYFRLYSTFYSVYDVFEKLVPVNTGESYPSATVTGGSLSYDVESLAIGSSTDGITINTISTPNSISFGTLLPNSEKISAQRFDITTNAYSGYQLFVYKKQDLISNNGSTINNFPGTNAFPNSWNGNPNSFGYHPSDDTLSGNNPSRFAADNSYAGFSSGLSEISYNPLPVKNEVVDLIYRIEIDETQAAGDYETEIVYILVPTF